MHGEHTVATLELVEIPLHIRVLSHFSVTYPKLLSDWPRGREMGEWAARQLGGWAAGQPGSRAAGQPGSRAAEQPGSRAASMQSSSLASRQEGSLLQQVSIVSISKTFQ